MLANLPSAPYTKLIRIEVDMSRSFTTLLSFLFCITVAAADYVCHDLGSILAYSSSSAVAINASRKIAAYGYHSDPPHSFSSSGFLWRGGQRYAISIALPADINDRGDIVGANSQGGLYGGRLIRNGKLHLLGTLGGLWGLATAINNNGLIVGRSTPTSLEPWFHAFAWQDGVMSDLGTLGGLSSGAEDVNNNGWIVGYGDVPLLGDRHPALWRDGNLIDLGSPPSRYYGVATGVNDNGEIVGYHYDNFDQYQAFYWKEGKMTELAPLPGWPGCIAQAINNHGIIVGSSTAIGGTSFASKATYWKDGVPHALPITIVGNSWAMDINERGDIVGESLVPVGLSVGGRATLWSKR